MNIVHVLDCLFAAGCCLIGSPCKHKGATPDTFALTVDKLFLNWFFYVTFLQIFQARIKILTEENTK